jgi:hypothetical protein
MLSISATFFLTERGYTFKRARRAGIKVRVMAVRLTQREASVSRVASGIQESTGFSKNIKKLSTLIIRDKGLVLGLALIILLILKNILKIN